MRKAALILSVIFLTGFLSACGLLPIPKYGLREGEALVVDVESITFYEKLTIMDLKDGRTKFDIDRSSSLRNDEFAKEVSAVFRENFLKALQERGVRVMPGAPIKLAINLGYGIKPTGKFSEVRALEIVMSFSKQGADTRMPAIFPFELTGLNMYPILFKPIDLSDELKSAKFIAKKLSEAAANSVVVKLREKGEVINAKK